MRVVVWNMSHWQKTPELRAGAWQALRDLKADVALLQETVPPADATNVVYKPIGGTRRWGSAVVGLTIAIEPLTHLKTRHCPDGADLLRTQPGSIAIATAKVGDRSIHFVSMYGVIHEGYADTTVNHQLSDLVPLFDSSEHRKNIVLGGDLNITTQWTGKEARYRDWESATFARIRAYGLRDCLDLARPDGALEGCACADAERCRHIRTQYHPRSDRPWQNDYVFASEALVSDGRLTSAVAVDDAATRELSDHLPLLIELTL